jgi:hypothetical protein
MIFTVAMKFIQLSICFSSERTFQNSAEIVTKITHDE